jgi:NADP-dependent 3-hydroxy acid dehydrogenase YdfG
MRLENKTALITGATGGMGRGSARPFAQEGATMFIAARNAERGNALAAQINDGDGQAHYVPLEATDQNQWTAIIRRGTSRMWCEDSSLPGIRRLTCDHCGAA